MEASSTAQRRQQLSGSAAHALSLAQRMALRRDEPPISVTPRDLLAGVLLAHSGGDALGDLVNHYHPDGHEECLDWLTQTLFDTAYGDLHQTLMSVPNGHVPIESPWRGFDPPLSPATERVFRRAQALATTHNPLPDRWIRLRDLIGGLLLTQSDALRDLRRELEPHGVPFEAIQFTFPRFLNQDDSTSYERFLNENPPYLPVADYDSDDNRGRLLEGDFLNIAPDVNAFAYLLTARDLQPPLAIGLFGDWGSGKSFFMRSLKQQIEEITARARASELSQQEIAIYRNVVQIEFNAWHYVDANLWASLADHIFVNLKLEEHESLELVEQRRQFLVNELTQQGAALRQAGTEQQELEAKLQYSNDRVAQLDAQITARERDLREVIVKSVTLDPELHKQINRELEQAGLATVDGENVAGELLEQLRRAEAMYQSDNGLRALLRGRLGWLRLVVAAIVLIGVPALIWGITYLADIPVVASTLATIGGVLTAGVGLMKAGLDAVDRSIARVKSREREIEQKIRESAPENSEITDLKQQIESIQAAQALVLKRKEEAEARILEIEQALDGLTPASLLSGFIQSKLGSDDYRKHLGLASLIRRDFHELSQLIDGYNRDLKTANQSRGMEQDGDDRPAEQDRRHHINRIILYIDDLDRCPPEQVIQVLQAVHLLLAFPLFVVVVAVDARWLTQSLRAHYRELLHGSDHRGAEDGLESATPSDYLEKIFQIPFWIRPLDDNDRAQLLQGLLDETTRGADTQNGQRSGRQPERRSVDPSGDGGTTDNGRSVENDQAGMTDGASATPADNGQPQVPPIDLNPTGLEISEVERDFMHSIQSLLGRSPRSVKRFFNVYRLVKSRAAPAAGDFVCAEELANYRIVMFLLAMVTGMPSISRELFRRFAAATAEETLEDVIKTVRDRVPATPETDNDLERITAWLAADTHAAWRAAHPADWRPWATHVSRFSYRMEWNDN